MACRPTNPIVKLAPIITQNGKYFKNLYSVEKEKANVSTLAGIVPDPLKNFVVVKPAEPSAARSCGTLTCCNY